jgi:dihydroorotate dehydrogenase (NAD+) catalytic subunit
MVFEITRPGKRPLELHTPVMCSAGMLGFGDAYKSIINVDKLGAVVTHPISYDPRTPARGPRVVPLDAGVLVHTGLPNPGLNKVLGRYRNIWTVMPAPIIVHLIATSEDEVRKSILRLNTVESVDAVELGLDDDIPWDEAEALVRAASRHAEKPVLVRLPLQDAYEIAEPVADAGADALVVGAPPRGQARDPLTGKLVSGRIYGPMVKAIALNVVGNLVGRLGEVPVIGAGGIHSIQDARDYIEVGARAVQVDSAVWLEPKLIEFIARDLGGYVVTRETDALPDEWFPGMTQTDRDRQNNADTGDGK